MRINKFLASCGVASRRKSEELIKEGKSKEDRFELLNEIARYQLEILNNAEKIKLLVDKWY